MFDSAAGILLIILGTIVIKPLIAEKINAHQITRPENTYSGSFSSDHDHAYIHLHKSEITGVLQGLGGSAALMLVTLSTVKSVGICLFFICLFGPGVILGIVGIACLVGSVIV
jgi:hypothetical protein